MEKEFYQKVAYIGLRDTDGSYMLNVPLYVKVSEVNKNGMTDGQEAVMHRISEVMMRRYERQISEFLASKKQGEISDESIVSGGV
jgi:hypothetical protein